MELRSYLIALLIFFVLKYNYNSPLKDVSEKEYYSLPLLYEFDNYDRCSPDSIYCIGSTYLDIPEESHMYPILQKMNNPFIYNHSRIYRGVCMTHTNNSAGCFIDPSLPVEKSLERCMKQSIQEEYGINAKFNKATCHNKDKTYPKDVYYYCFIILIVTIFWLNVFATFLDLNYFHCISDNSFVNSFSLRKNWRRFTQPDNNSHKCFNGLKAINSQIVVIVHCLGDLIGDGTANPSHIERYWLFPDFGLVTNCYVLMQSFFMITSFLRTEKTFRENDKSKASYSMIFKALLDRYFRIMPMFIIGAFFWATVFPHLGDGPMWHLRAEHEYDACREAWPAVLMLHNNLRPVVCQIHGWYLSAEFQMYVAITLISIYLVKNEERCLRTLTTILFASLILLFWFIYSLELPLVSIGVIMDFPTLWNDVPRMMSYAVTYFTPFGSVPSVIFGMLWYCLYRKLKDHRDELKKNKVFLTTSRIAVFLTPWYALVMLCLSPLLATSKFSATLLATLERLGYSVLTATYLTACMLNIDESQPWFRILNWPGWTIVSRLGLSSLLVHVPLMKLVASRNYPEKFTFIRFMMLTSGLITMNLACSTLVHLLVELPLVQLYKAISSSKEIKNLNKCSKDMRRIQQGSVFYHDKTN